jgi:hypothetical protein
MYSSVVAGGGFPIDDLAKILNAATTIESFPRLLVIVRLDDGSIVLWAVDIPPQPVSAAVARCVVAQLTDDASAATHQVEIGAGDLTCRLLPTVHDNLIGIFGITPKDPCTLWGELELTRKEFENFTRDSEQIRKVVKVMVNLSGPPRVCGSEFTVGVGMKTDVVKLTFDAGMKELVKGSVQPPVGANSDVSMLRLWSDGGVHFTGPTKGWDAYYTAVHTELPTFAK